MRLFLLNSRALLLYPLFTRFFPRKSQRKEDDIPNLWDLFEAAINYADNPSEINKITFIRNFDKVSLQYGIKWNITIILYWIRPYSYLNLDEPNREYLLKIEDIEYIKRFVKLFIQSV